MKLSVRKRRGFHHVKGGRVLKVVKPHAVRLATLNLAEPEGPRRPSDDGWVFTEVGDLALEIIDRKTGKVGGYSYLSGPAIQLNTYPPFDAAWYGDEVPLRRVDLTPSPKVWADSTDDMERGRWLKAVSDQLAEIKYSTEPCVGVFRYRRSQHEPDVGTLGRVLVALWDPEIVTTSPTKRVVMHRTKSPGESDLIGFIEGRGRREGHVLIHFQAPARAQDYSVTDFQGALIWSAVE